MLVIAGFPVFQGRVASHRQTLSRQNNLDISLNQLSDIELLNKQSPIVSLLVQIFQPIPNKSNHKVIAFIFQNVFELKITTAGQDSDVRFDSLFSCVNTHHAENNLQLTLEPIPNFGIDNLVTDKLTFASLKITIDENPSAQLELEDQKNQKPVMISLHARVNHPIDIGDKIISLDRREAIGMAVKHAREKLRVEKEEKEQYLREEAGNREATDDGN
jgi:hypothetical protein